MSISNLLATAPTDREVGSPQLNPPANQTPLNVPLAASGSMRRRSGSVRSSSTAGGESHHHGRRRGGSRRRNDTDQQQQKLIVVSKDESEEINKLQEQLASEKKQRKQLADELMTMKSAVQKEREELLKENEALRKNGSLMEMNVGTLKALCADLARQLNENTYLAQRHEVLDDTVGLKVEVEVNKHVLALQQQYDEELASVRAEAEDARKAKSKVEEECTAAVQRMREQMHRVLGDRQRTVETMAATIQRLEEEKSKLREALAHKDNIISAKLKTHVPATARSAGRSSRAHGTGNSFVNLSGLDSRAAAPAGDFFVASQQPDDLITLRLRLKSSCEPRDRDTVVNGSRLSSAGQPVTSTAGASIYDVEVQANPSAVTQLHNVAKQQAQDASGISGSFSGGGSLLTETLYSTGTAMWEFASTARRERIVVALNVESY